jgi:hypothetical protein
MVLKYKNCFKQPRILNIKIKKKSKYKKFIEKGKRASPTVIETCCRYPAMARGSHGLAQLRYCLDSHCICSSGVSV